MDLFCNDQKLLKKKYHVLARKYHPDKNNHSSSKQKNERTKKFQDINNAYETLSNETTKLHYDGKLKEYLKPAVCIGQKELPKPVPKPKTKPEPNKRKSPVFIFSYKEQGAYGAYVSINQKQTNPAQYKRLVREIVNLPHQDKLLALKKIKMQLNYFYNKNEKQVRYEILLTDLKSELINSLHYQYANIHDSRFHLFHLTLSETEKMNISFNAHGLSGDNLKTAILTDFSASIKSVSSQKDLMNKVNNFKKSVAYTKLATGQGLITTMFRLKTSSVAALDQIVGDALKRLEP